MNPLSAALLSALLLAACGPDAPDTARAQSNPPVNASAPASPASDNALYDFSRPDVSFVLPEELREISGLTVLADGRVAAVQDEEGLIYVLDAATGALLGRYPFAGSGDYEGIARVDDRLFVLRADATLFEVSGWASEQPQVRQHRTGIDPDCDAEGLAHDASGNRLLIACKEEPGADLDEKRFRAVYAFDLATGQHLPEPAFVLDRDAIGERVEGKGKFKPSALGVHPATGELYVLSASLKAVVGLDRDGTLRHTWPLPGDAFEQPEGLAFLPDGGLVIASEGDDGPAMLYRFSAADSPHRLP